MAKRFTIQPVVISVVRNKGMYLVTKRSGIDAEDLPDFKDKWELAGGGIEFGEHPVEALHREVMEELGIKVRIISQNPYIHTEKRKNWQGIFLCYLCTPKDESPIITLNEECSEYRWIYPSELPALPQLPGVSEVILHFHDTFPA